MLGETPGHEGEDFIAPDAPDETQRVENPETAEDVARASHEQRSSAASMRKDKKTMETIGANQGTIDWAEENISRLDHGADWIEEMVPIQKEYAKKAETMTVDELRSIVSIMKEKRSELVRRIDMLSSVGATNTEAIATEKKNFERELGINDTIDRAYRKRLEELS